MTSAYLCKNRLSTWQRCIATSFIIVIDSVTLPLQAIEAGCLVDPNEANDHHYSGPVSAAGPPPHHASAAGAVSGPMGCQKAETLKRSALQEDAGGALHDGRQKKLSAALTDGEWSATFLSNDVKMTTGLPDSCLNPIHAELVHY